MSSIRIANPSAELIAAAEACGLHCFGHPASDTYRGWSIHQGRWPEPAWSATGPDYDASYEGPEDGWVSNGQSVDAPTREALIEEINAWIEEHSA